MTPATLVVVPTYNERDNLEVIAERNELTSP